ncbi:PQQ-dependent sugar dehydrogenase [Streptomyces sp. NPDC049881]|uniref:PQQ-dependent sugar dehydrogenase n=1 Tax=Streptomyces sp. NPDC049881 TaxID=3155778 RepID=UPI0034330738
MRTPVRVAAAAVVVALAAGCSVGPASDRAAREGVVPAGNGGTGGGDSPEGDDAGGTGGGTIPEPTDSPEPTEAPEPPPEPAPATGTATVAERLPAGADASCCLVALPDGSVLTGSADGGVIQRVTAEGTVTPVGTVNGATALLGLAVEPGFDPSDSGWLYLSYAQGSSARVARLTYYGANDPGEQLGSATDALVTGIPLGSGRDGGALGFGPDGMLYVGTGDAGVAAQAADPESYAGKILRMQPDGRVPADNPQEGSLVYASGHGDVTGFAFDALDRLWAVDAGGADGVELNSIAPGGDYAAMPPVHTWPEPFTPGTLAFAAGSLWLPAAGGPGLWRVPLNGTELTADPQLLLADEGLTAPAAAQPGPDGDGGLWLLDGGTGDLLRTDVS